jgi:hypothetical protein
MAEFPIDAESGTVYTALDRLDPPANPDVARALRRQLVLQAQSRAAPRSTFMTAASQRLAFLRRPVPAIPIAAGLLLVLSLFLSPVRTLADQLLTIFRAQDVALIDVDPRSMAAIPDLTQFGDMQGSPSIGRNIRGVADLAAASAATGFQVRAPARIPAGFAPQPSRVGVTDPTNVSFTFRSQKAAAYLASINRTDFSLPPKFDGATLRVVVYPSALLSYSPANAAPAPVPPEKRAAAAATGRAPDLLSAANEVFFLQTKSPELEASGVSADDLRNFLLSIPGIPPATASQLRAIGDWKTTLPVPVPANVAARKVQVNGGPGFVFSDPQLQVGGVFWLRNGMVYAIGGPLSDNQLLDMASSVP